jgi:alkylation response protein AidB-like acyl-CoA dehydrogenase
MEHLTSPQFAELRDGIRRYITNELIPLEKELRLTLDEPWPREMLGRIWKRSYELGFLGATLSSELGGPGLSILETCLLKMDIAESGAILAPHVLGDLSGPPRVGNLMPIATSDQIERFFMPVIRGDKGICFALTEPHSGSDAASIKTRAVREGDELVINGHKHYISGSTFADIAIVICVTDTDAGTKGITAVLVDLHAKGVTRVDDYLPMSGQHIDSDLLFDNVRVPVDNVIGGFGNGLRLGMARINVNRLLHCPTMLGLARMTYRRSVEYAQTRQQFGGPIARFQAIQHMLADMAASLYACESMVLNAAMKADRGADLRMEASACKLFVSERCFEVADKAVQIHGNVGVTHNHPVEHAFRKLRMFRIVTGTSEIQRNTIAKEILAGAK